MAQSMGLSMSNTRETSPGLGSLPKTNSHRGDRQKAALLHKTSMVHDGVLAKVFRSGHHDCGPYQRTKTREVNERLCE